MTTVDTNGDRVAYKVWDAAAPWEGNESWYILSEDEIIITGAGYPIPRDFVMVFSIFDETLELKQSMHVARSLHGSVKV